MDEVGSDCESREFGVPDTLAEDDDSRLSVVVSEDLKAGPSSPKSSQLFSGDCFSPSGLTLPTLAFVLRRLSLVGVFRGGVAGRLLTELAPVDILDLLLVFPGVLPSPSSFLSASAVSASTSLDQLPAFRVFCESGAGSEPRLSRFGAVKYDAEGLMPGGVLPVPTAPKLLCDAEPRKNWLMDAEDGEGGRWEKSFGAKCFRISWLGAWW